MHGYTHAQITKTHMVFIACVLTTYGEHEKGDYLYFESRNCKATSGEGYRDRLFWVEQPVVRGLETGRRQGQPERQIPVKILPNVEAGELNPVFLLIRDATQGWLLPI